MSGKSEFVHLHVHSYFSLLAGLASPEALVARAAALGQPALALTDVNNMFGAIRFYRAARAAGVRPIFGVQLNVDGDGSTVVLAETYEGYRNLLTLATLVRSEPLSPRAPGRFGTGVHVAPESSEHRVGRGSSALGSGVLSNQASAPNHGAAIGSPHGVGGTLTLNDLLRHSDGLIALVGALGPGEGAARSRGPRIGMSGTAMSRPIAGAGLDNLRRVAGALRDRLGPGNVFLELQNQSLDGQAEENAAIAALAGELGLGVVATNDVRYLYEADARAHAALLAMDARTTLDDPERPTMGSAGFFLTSEEEMRARFREFSEALANAAAISERCCVELETRSLRLPIYRRREMVPESGPTAPAARALEPARGGTERDLGAQAEGGPGPGIPAEAAAEPNRLLKERAWSGARRRFVAGPGAAPAAIGSRKGTEGTDADIPENVRERLIHELDIICGRGLASYFLIVADIVDEAKDRGIRVGPGRGSAASSLVAYCLGITDVDPLAHGLVFERFLNPERVRMPDIDIDVSDTRRDELLHYIRQRFGEERVAQIVTFGTLAARAAVREAGRLLVPSGGREKGRTPRSSSVSKDAIGAGFGRGPRGAGTPGSRGARKGSRQIPSVEAADRIARLIPSEPGMTLERARVGSLELQRLLQSDRTASRVFALAKAVEGVPRHVSVHAAGVVIGDGPLDGDIPLMQTADGVRITQFAMDDVEALGFLKMDVLGLRTLTVIDEAWRWIRADAAVGSPGKPAKDASFDVNDAEVYEALRRHGTDGVFQLETPMFRRLVGRLQPTRFGDIVALLALGRPGPMQRVEEFIRRRRGQAPIQYVHLVLEPILRETFGIIVYQEQVMHIAMQVAGYSPAEADLLRRRLTDVGGGGGMLPTEERERFVWGAQGRGLTRVEAEAVLGELVQFAGYGFAKSHSAAYGLLTYETAWLRTRHTAAFLAALLNSHQHDPERIRRYVAAAKDWGVRVVGPDINVSGVEFQPLPQSEGSAAAVVYGLSGIRHVGRGAAEAVVKARETGPFRSFDDLRRRLPAVHNNARLLEALIRAGACDSLGQSRESMLAAAVGRGFQPEQMSLSDTIDISAQQQVFARRDSASPTRSAGLAANSATSPGPGLVLRLHVGPAALPALQRLLAAHKGDVPVTLELPASDGGWVRLAVGRDLWVDDSPKLRAGLQSWERTGKLTSLRNEP